MMTNTCRLEAGTEQGEPETAAAPAAPAAPPPAGEGDPAEKFAREAAELKDKLLRALAEMENVRRRSEREVAEARIRGITSFASDILTVADNMARALEAPAAELRQSADPGAKSLLAGVELIERELMRVLEKHGVRKFEPHGEKFDPNLHQAMYEVPDPLLPAGTVAQVVQAGYMIGDRVLRPALVVVAKGGPKAPAAGSANDNAGSSPEGGPDDAA
jgi:molecular chaperone GrpE